MSQISIGTFWLWALLLKISQYKIKNAKEKIGIAILFHPTKGENYSTLAAIHLKNQDMDAALITVNRGFTVPFGFGHFYSKLVNINCQFL